MELKVSQPKPASLSGKEILTILILCCLGLFFIIVSVNYLITSPISPLSENFDSGVNENKIIGLFGMPCVSDNECGLHLRCIGPSKKTMFCQCPGGDHQIYSEDIEGGPRCVGKIGSVCHPRFMSYCVSNANCTRVSKNDEFRCECLSPGYIINSKRECDLAFGSPCSSSTPCSIENGLACREGECKCKNRGDVFEPERGQCSVQVGGSCRQNIDCVKLATCYKLQKNWGRCRSTV